MRSISTHYSWNPQQKVSFFHILLSLIVSSTRRMLPFDIWPSFPVNASFVPILARQSYSRLNVLRLQFSDSVVFNCHGLLNEAAYLAALRRLHTVSHTGRPSWWLEWHRHNVAVLTVVLCDFQSSIVTLTAAMSRYCASQASRRCPISVPKSEDYFVRIGDERSSTQSDEVLQPFYFIL